MEKEKIWVLNSEKAGKKTLTAFAKEILMSVSHLRVMLASSVSTHQAHFTVALVPLDTLEMVSDAMT